MKFNKNTNLYASIYIYIYIHTEIEREGGVKGYRWRYRRIIRRSDLNSGRVFSEGLGTVAKK